jgi:hypothetical protein
MVKGEPSGCRSLSMSSSAHASQWLRTASSGFCSVMSGTPQRVRPYDAQTQGVIYHGDPTLLDRIGAHTLAAAPPG